MKTLLLTTAMFVLLTNSVSAQERTLTLDNFTGIHIGQAFHATLIQSDRNEIRVPDTLTDDMFRVVDGTLRIFDPNPRQISTTRGTTTVNQPQHAGVQITVLFKTLETIDASGAARITAPQRIAGRNLLINASGAAQMTLSELAYEQVTSNISGAANLTLSGTVGKQIVESSGASRLETSRLYTRETHVNMSGTSFARISADTATGRTSGMANVVVMPGGKDEIVRVRTAQQQAQQAQIRVQQAQDRAQRDIERAHRQVATAQQHGRVMVINRADLVNIDSLVFDSQSVVVDVDTNTRTVVIGNRTVTTTTSQNRRNHQPKVNWNPRYGIFDFGWIAYGQNFFKHDLPAGYENMELSRNNSFAINMNLFRYGYRLGAPSSNWGIGIGAGMGWDVYRFYYKSMIPLTSRQTNTFTMDSHRYADNEECHFTRSALRVTWLRVPVYLQYGQGRRGFFATAGVVGNVRMGARSRVIYDLDGEQDIKTKDHFNLNAFRADAEVRLGFRNVSVFATYGLTDMFLQNPTKRGPELSAFSFGISFWPG